jgi:DNA ligase 1
MLKLADFQTTMKRRRKYDIGLNAKEIPLQFQVFDILLLNGKSTMNAPYVERRGILTSVIQKNNLLLVDEFVITSDPQEINNQYRQQISQGLEGVVVKKADSPYVPGRTGWRWVKMKEEETSSGKLPDTVDCLVMGYTVGKGKRAAFGLGQFLVGVKDGDKFKTVSKVGTGLTDAEFKDFSCRMHEYRIKDKPKEYLADKIYEPDHWIEPKFVVELAGDDLTLSPTHSSGYGLRFPRLVRFRADKSPAQVTTLKELAKLYKMQGR